MFDYSPGFGGLRMALSFAMMINVSMLIGLTQGDTARDALNGLRTIKYAAAEIKQHEPEMRRFEWQMRNLDKITSGKSALFD